MILFNYSKNSKSNVKKLVGSSIILCSAALAGKKIKDSYLANQEKSVANELLGYDTEKKQLKMKFTLNSKDDKKDIIGNIDINNPGNMNFEINKKNNNKKIKMTKFNIKTTTNSIDVNYKNNELLLDSNDNIISKSNTNFRGNLNVNENDDIQIQSNYQSFLQTSDNNKTTIFQGIAQLNQNQIQTDVNYINKNDNDKAIIFQGRAQLNQNQINLCSSYVNINKEKKQEIKTNFIDNKNTMKLNYKNKIEKDDQLVCLENVNIDANEEKINSNYEKIEITN